MLEADHWMVPLPNTDLLPLMQDGEAASALPPLRGPGGSIPAGAGQPAPEAATAADPPAAEPPAVGVQRPRGLTRAQLQQQAAWGSQAGSLEAVLRQRPARPPQQVEVEVQTDQGEPASS